MSDAFAIRIHVKGSVKAARGAQTPGILIVISHLPRYGGNISFRYIESVVNSIYALPATFPRWCRYRILSFGESYRRVAPDQSYPLVLEIARTLLSSTDLRAL